MAVGLAHRPELLALRRFHQGLDIETLPAARHVLASVDALLGMASFRSHAPGSRLAEALGRHRRKADAADLVAARAQLTLYTVERERAVAEEIAQAVRNVRIRRQQVEVARLQVASWSAEVEKSRAREAQGLESFAVSLPAKSGLLKAQGTMIEHEVAWNVALVKLKQSQGLLVDQCGPVLSAPELRARCHRDRFLHIRTSTSTWPGKGPAR